MTTSEARIRIVEMLYEAEYHENNDEESAFQRVSLRDDNINSYVKKIYRIYTDKSEEINKIISDSANGWKLNRMSGVTKAIIRMSVAEMLYTDVPAKVSINEAVEISKKYDEPRTKSFINGILNDIARSSGKIKDE